MTKQPRKPRIINLAEEKPANDPTKAGTSTQNSARKPRAQKDLSLVTLQANDEFPDDGQDIPPSRPVSSGFSWGKLLLAALAGLISLGIGLAIDQLITELFMRQTWLGWTASALAALLVLAAFAMALREIWGISRLNTIAAIRTRAADIQSGNSSGGGARIVADLQSIYADRPDLANSRAQFESDRGNILDDEDLLQLFETRYMSALDERAKSLVMQSAQRVSVVTAISPRALVDIAYVLMENTRLIRRISRLYGGRPGALGFWKLTRNVLGHLAVTGVIATTDSLIQQLVGHGLAARLSTKLGEGVVNGLLTARIGVAAIEQARPLNFKASPRPAISDFLSQLSASFTKSGKH